MAIICYLKKVLAENKIGTNPYIADLSHEVFPKGFEPPSSEPESDILSIELRKQNSQI